MARLGKARMQAPRALIVFGTAFAVAAAGCAWRPENRFLNCQARPPGIESKSWDLHDPFPDESIGPDTDTRPRQFTTPRSTERVKSDLRLMDTTHRERAGYAAATRQWSPFLPPWRQQIASQPEKEIPAGWAAFDPLSNGQIR